MFVLYSNKKKEELYTTLSSSSRLLFTLSSEHMNLLGSHLNLFYLPDFSCCPIFKLAERISIRVMTFTKDWNLS